MRIAELENLFNDYLRLSIEDFQKAFRGIPVAEPSSQSTNSHIYLRLFENTVSRRFSENLTEYARLFE